MIKYKIDEGKFVGLVFIDFTKAFDTIDHNILFQKLTFYCITRPPLQLLRSYLLDREQTVSISGVLSPTTVNNIGVPQGSILGPILFLLYVNYLPNCLSSINNCLLYADDTTLFASDINLDILTPLPNTDLKNLIDWCEENKLCINPQKTHYMVFSSPNRARCTLSPVYVNTHAIYPSQHCSFLGVELNLFLKFTFQINSLKNKAANGIRALIKARHYFSPQTLITLYYAFIHSHFNYSMVSWGLTYRSHVTPLQHLQNQAVRIITRGSYNAHVRPLFLQLNLLRIEELIKYNLGITAYRLIKTPGFFCVIGIDHLTNPNVTRFALQNNFLLPKVRINYGSQTVRFAIIKFWNTLPVTVKTALSLPRFKSLLQSYICEQSYAIYFVSVHFEVLESQAFIYIGVCSMFCIEMLSHRIPSVLPCLCILNVSLPLTIVYSILL